MKKRNWVSLIDEETAKDTRKFVPLNESTNTKVVNATDLKTQILIETIFDALNKFNNKLITESDNNEGFFLSDTETWQDFKNQVKLIGSLLAMEDTKIQEALSKIEQVFIDISGDPNKGAQDFSKLNDYLYGSKSPIKGLEPKLSIQQIFNSISSDSEYKNDFIQFFKYMILPDKSKAQFSHIMMNDISIRESLSQQLSKKKIDINSLLRAFSNITQLDNFSKNGTRVGKGEVAIALFFGDAFLPSDEGDIELSSLGGKYELKINGGSISRRLATTFFPNGLFGKSGNWKKFRNISIPDHLIKFVENEIHKNKISATDDKKLKQLLDDIELEASKSSWSGVNDDVVNALKFRTLFSATFSSYPQPYETMVILNTSKEYGIDSPLFNEVPTKLKQIDSSNWWKNGNSVLDNLPSKIQINFATISGKSEITFKIFHLAK